MYYYVFYSILLYSMCTLFYSMIQKQVYTYFLCVFICMHACIRVPVRRGVYIGCWSKPLVSSRHVSTTGPCESKESCRKSEKHFREALKP